MAANVQRRDACFLCVSRPFSYSVADARKERKKQTTTTKQNGREGQEEYLLLLSKYPGKEAQKARKTQRKKDGSWLLALERVASSFLHFALHSLKWCSQKVSFAD